MLKLLHYVRERLWRLTAFPRHHIPAQDIRKMLSKTYIEGDGLEVGALHCPLAVSRRAKVQYVDRLPVEGLRDQYPELAKKRLVEVDILTNGETLKGIDDASQDFVIANQFLEHCEDPIGTMKNFFRVLRPGGIVYLSIPDKNLTFDVNRPVTSLEHLRRDHLEGPEWSRRQHFEEWSRLVNGTEGEEAIAKEADLNMSIHYSIHYHVWNQFTFWEFLSNLRSEWTLPFECLFFRHNHGELIYILRKDKSTPKTA